MSYATYADVTALLASRATVIGTTSAPTTAQITEWIAQAEAQLEGALAGGGVSVPVTSAGGIKQMKVWACWFAAGMAILALGDPGSGDANAASAAMLERFDKALDKIEHDPAGAEAALTGGGSSDSSRRLRCYPLDNADGKTIAAGDFDPVFDRDEVF